jgi:hypothetical protein
VVTKKEREGYLLIDHRESPGFSCNEVGPQAASLFGAGKKFEGSTLTCAHTLCGGRVVVINPLRTRERGHCYQCDRFICDECALDYKLTGVCRSVNRFTDDFIEAAVKGRTLPTFKGD